MLQCRPHDGLEKAQKSKGQRDGREVVNTEFLYPLWEVNDSSGLQIVNQRGTLAENGEDTVADVALEEQVFVLAAQSSLRKVVNRQAKGVEGDNEKDYSLHNENPQVEEIVQIWVRRH